MSVLQVLHIPDERLRKVAKPVEEVNAEIQRIVDDMFETMYAEKGIGLAYIEHTFESAAFLIKTADSGMHRVIGHVNKDSRQLNILGERENEQVFIAAFNCLRLKFSSPVQEGVLYGTGVFSVAELRLFICHSKC